MKDSARRGAALEIASVIGLACLVLAALRFAVGAQAFDLSSPFSYSGDGLSHGVVIKSIIEEGWFPAYNQHLGAPFVAAQFDYPGTEALHYAAIKAIALFTREWHSVENLYVLLGFVLCAISAYIVLRSMRLALPLALTGALLFSLLPFHFLRTEHVFLAQYFAVPIAVWLALQVWQRDVFRASERMHSTRARSGLLSLFASVVVGASGIYYAAFGIAIVLAAAIASALESRSARGSMHALRTCVVIVATVAATVMPTLIYSDHEGPNEEVGLRSPADSDLYGLTLAELVFPRPGHRLRAAREFTARYHETSKSNLERETASLGVIGTVGFLLLGAVLLRRFAGSATYTRITDHLALLALVCVLIGTIGGLGSVFAWTVSPTIRGYARISVFIAFCSLAMAMLALQRIVTYAVPAAYRRTACTAVAAMVAVAGVWDQTSPGDLRRDDTARQFASDKDFVDRAQAQLPPNTAIYQLPYHPYPEAGPLNAMADYDLFRGYLHSERLRWSHGNMKGRTEDLWQRQLATRSIDVQLQAAMDAGFGAIQVDRRGFPDRATSLEDSLRESLGRPVAVSDDRNLALYSTQQVRAATTVPTDSLPPIDAPLALGAAGLTQVGLQGFGEGEGWGRWTVGHEPRIMFIRALPAVFSLEFAVVNVLAKGRPYELSLSVGNETRRVEVHDVPSTVRLQFTSNGHEHIVKFHVPKPVSAATAGGDPHDRRLLGVGIGTLKVTALPGRAS